MIVTNKNVYNNILVFGVCMLGIIYNLQEIGHMHLWYNHQCVCVRGWCAVISSSVRQIGNHIIDTPKM